MNFSFKALAIGVGAATAVSVALDAAPAQALSIGSRLDFIGFADFGLNNGQVTTFTPDSVVPLIPLPSILVEGTGDFAGVFSLASIESVPSVPFAGVLPDFIEGEFFFGSAFSIDLTSFVQFDNDTINLSGLFDDGTPLVGSITFQPGGSRSFSGTFTAVPTPALIPAALGFGAAMLRKRKGEKAEKEAVGVKA
ncbi:PTPA-CTERM sorting domain-containing protein [Leptolyngbya sp. ST-U4]|uniref:PTPA-CTERM sorting domain-containing protein n=1 Tax=Leptolyngbya sp. ST-U4 TaxID=2933912 RepID=UPI0019981B26|nr:PTPA-CTERM sorting domain-containing protein [Cyanobacteria bacterium FACHB-502]